MGNQNDFVFIILILVAAHFIDAEHIPFYTSVMHNMHNEYRYRHDTPAVKLDKVLSSKALAYLRIDGDKVEFENDEYGANIYRHKNSITSSTTGVSAETVFLSWYEEGENYDYSKEPTNRGNTEHFTQILWKKTTKIGISTMYAGADLIVVVMYDPKGNKKGKFTDNLRPPKVKSILNF